MAEEKKGFFKRLVSGLTKTRDNIVAGFDSIFSGFSSIDDDFYEELEETLIMGDIGVRATDEIIEELKSKIEFINEPCLKDYLYERLEKKLEEKYSKESLIQYYKRKIRELEKND